METIDTVPSLRGRRKRVQHQLMMVVRHLFGRHPAKGPGFTNQQWAWCPICLRTR